MNRLFRIGFYFGLLETAYFGWCVLPSCTAEVMCDMLALMLMFEGILEGLFGKGSK